MPTSQIASVAASRSTARSNAAASSDAQSRCMPAMLSPRNSVASSLVRRGSPCSMMPRIRDW